MEEEGLSSCLTIFKAEDKDLTTSYLAMLHRILTSGQTARVWRKGTSN